MSSRGSDTEETLSPAERYAAAAKRNRIAKTPFGTFRDQLGFAMDEFQQVACQKLQDGDSVLVAAPTGAGKTVVGEFAIHLALTAGQKAFYTTPIKALSNQKYTDLVERYGTQRVGLLTGDVARNPDAQIVVMTTEVLRNMLYADSEALTNLRYVVMDEVHYLADRFRGAVWEEVIIHLPEHVQVAALSATVSNAEEFGAWLDSVRGSTSVVVSEHRPVPLWQHVMTNHELFDLFADQDPRAGGSTFKVNPELARFAEEQKRAQQPAAWGRHGGAGARNRKYRGGRGGRDRDRGGRDQKNQAAQVVSRPKMVRMLNQAGLLPCITFVFSRNGCDAAVEQCLRSDLDLTTRAEKAEIERVVYKAGESLAENDRLVLGFGGWLDGLRRGFAAHHAGMLPPFKEVVEELFAGGYLKVVFATETLALGINMPARTVVIDKLVKFNGETHAPITPGEYTQLTGRAGRRGIDVEGHAVVLWRPGLDPNQVAGLASRRTYPLNSSFKPTYNMSVNLLATYGRDRARNILEASFAQFQADRSVSGLAKEVRSQEKSLAAYEEAMQCHLGDFTEYARLRRELSQAEKAASRTRNRARRAADMESLTKLQVGDIIDMTGSRNLGECVVVSPAGNPTNPRVGVVTQKGQLRRIGVDDLKEPVVPFAGVKLPHNLQTKTPTQRKNIAAWMREAIKRGDEPISPASDAPVVFRYQNEVTEDRVEELRKALRAHPCHACSEREDHARWANRWAKLRSETDRLVSKISSRTNTISRTFDRLLVLLTDFGYVTKDEHGQDQVTERGQRLRRIYGDRDLLTSMVIEDGVAEEMNPEDLAGLAALLVFQAPDEEQIYQPKMPTTLLQDALDATDALWYELQHAESEAQLSTTPQPHPGLVWPIFRWVRGNELMYALRGSDLAPGDFVRWARQVIDMLDQLAKLPGAPGFSRKARRARDLVNRGIVSYTATVEEHETPDANGDDDVDTQN